MVVPVRVKRREGKINDRVKAEDQGCVMWVWHPLLALQKRTSLGTDKPAHTRTATQKGWLPGSCTHLGFMPWIPPVLVLGRFVFCLMRLRLGKENSHQVS